MTFAIHCIRFCPFQNLGPGLSSFKHIIRKCLCFSVCKVSSIYVLPFRRCDYKIHGQTDGRTGWFQYPPPNCLLEAKIINFNLTFKWNNAPTAILPLFQYDQLAKDNISIQFTNLFKCLISLLRLGIDSLLWQCFVN